MKKQKKNIKIDPYTLMSVEFEGFPKVNVIKPLVRMVLTKYKLSESDHNLNGIAKILIYLKQEKKVSELEILKHIVSSGDISIQFKMQAAISAVYLARIGN